MNISSDSALRESILAMAFAAATGRVGFTEEDQEWKEFRASAEDAIELRVEQVAGAFDTDYKGRWEMRAAIEIADRFMKHNWTGKCLECRGEVTDSNTAVEDRSQCMDCFTKRQPIPTADSLFDNLVSIADAEVSPRTISRMSDLERRQVFAWLDQVLMGKVMPAPAVLRPFSKQMGRLNTPAYFPPTEMDLNHEGEMKMAEHPGEELKGSVDSGS